MQSKVYSAVHLLGVGLLPAGKRLHIRSPVSKRTLPLKNRDLRAVDRSFQFCKFPTLAFSYFFAFNYNIFLKNAICIIVCVIFIWVIITLDVLVIG